MIFASISAIATIPWTTPIAVSRTFECASLLDVQLEVAVPGALLTPRLHDALRIAADGPNRIRPPDTVPHVLHVGRRDVAGDDAAAGETAVEGHAFLGGPDDDFERMARLNAPPC